MYLTPSWFFYRPQIISLGAEPVAIALQPEDNFALPLEAIKAAITSKTKVLLLNSPHNPSGRIWSSAELQSLAELLAPHGIFVIHDASYQQVRFQPEIPPSMAAYYPRTVLVYTWGKILLAPGQRIGFVLASPLLASEERRLLVPALDATAMLSYAYANSLMQRAIPRLAVACPIDLQELKDKRDFMVAKLSQLYFKVVVPDGTFYLLVSYRQGFTNQWIIDLLAHRGVYVLSGTYFECPTYFRISLTASMKMCQDSIPVFREVLDQLHSIESMIQ